MFMVYQNNSTRKFKDSINKLGWSGAAEKHPEVKAYLDGSQGSKKWDPEHFFYMDFVATVDTDDLEEAFRLMNVWDEPERVFKHADQVRSLSVGDVLVSPAGAFLVDNYGFAKAW